MTTIEIHEFQGCVSDLTDRAQEGEAVTITKQGHPVARLVPAELPTPSAKTTRTGDGSRYLPTPIKLRGVGPSAVSYVSENRR